MFISLKHKQHGSMLVMALFVMVVISLLGITLITTFSSTSGALTYDVAGTRAYQAAHSGMQQVKASAMPIGATAGMCTGTQASPPGLSSVEGLVNCRYDTLCTTTDVVKDGDDYRYYRFTSTGTCQFGDRWASRTLHDDAWIPR